MITHSLWFGAAPTQSVVTSFEQGKVLQRWANATIEDHNLTHTVRDLKRKVHFVPDCIAVTHTEKRTWKQVIEFTNRQIVMTFRMGLKAQWWATLLALLPKALLVIGSIPFIIFYSERFLLVLLVPFFEIQSFRIFSRNLPLWLRDMPKIRETLRATSLVVPVAMFLAGLNAVYALFSEQDRMGRRSIRNSFGNKVSCFRTDHGRG